VKNKFENFFNDPTNVIKDKKFQPSLEQKVQSLMLMAGKFPNWWNQQPLRLMVATISHECTRELGEMMERGEKPDMHIACGAFMMLLNDILQLTSENACEEEKEMFKWDDEDENA
jgi:hypothetical protein